MALAVVSLLCSCGQGKDTETHSANKDNSGPVAPADGTETRTGKDRDDEKTPNRGVKIVYSSPEAANAPKYDESQKNDWPLSLADPFAHSFIAVNIATIGAETKEDNSKSYMVVLYCQEADTVEIESIKLPDSRFEVKWSGCAKYRKGILSQFCLTSKEPIQTDDYRFILTYKGDKYSPQTFHINLHPDVYQLLKEMESRDAAQ